MILYIYYFIYTQYRVQPSKWLRRRAERLARLYIVHIIIVHTII